MKKKSMINLFFVILSMLLLCACQNANPNNQKTTDQKAFEISKRAYENIKDAYEITYQLGGDVYDAWLVGVYESDQMKTNGVHHLAEKLGIEDQEVRDGIIYQFASDGEIGYEITDVDRSEYKDYVDIFFSIDPDHVFSGCIYATIGVYHVNGKIEEASAALTEAKAQMRSLSEDYSDYEHYPNLKSFYSTTQSFFEYCQEPSGSFEQAKITLNDYENNARALISDLDFIFGD